MKLAGNIRRLLKVAGTSAATAAWAWLFYANYWNASIVAFGDATTQVTALRLLFWKYLAAGAALLAAWAISLRPEPAAGEQTVGQKVRVRGH